MSDAIQNFLLSHFPITGLAAYSVRSSDTLLESQCLSKSLYPGTAEQMLARIVKNGRALLPSGHRPAHYCWTFEAHQVYVAARPDGLCLVLLMENNVAVQQSAIKDVLQGFLEMNGA